MNLRSHENVGLLSLRTIGSQLLISSLNIIMLANLQCFSLSIAVSLTAYKIQAKTVPIICYKKRKVAV